MHIFRVSFALIEKEDRDEMRKEILKWAEMLSEEAFEFFKKNERSAFFLGVGAAYAVIEEVDEDTGEVLKVHAMIGRLKIYGERYLIMPVVLGESFFEEEDRGKYDEMVNYFVVSLIYLAHPPGGRRFFCPCLVIPDNERAKKLLKRLFEDLFGLRMRLEVMGKIRVLDREHSLMKGEILEELERRKKGGVRSESEVEVYCGSDVDLFFACKYFLQGRGVFGDMLKSLEGITEINEKELIQKQEQAAQRFLLDGQKKQ